MSPIDMASLGEYIREQRRNAQLSMRQLAERADVSNPYLSQIERGMRKPSAQVLLQIAKGLRISAESLYVKAGILEDDRDSVSTVEVLTHDQSITDRQRQVLLDIYLAFQGENASASSNSNIDEGESSGSHIANVGTTNKRDVDPLTLNDLSAKDLKTKETLSR